MHVYLYEFIKILISVIDSIHFQNDFFINVNIETDYLIKLQETWTYSIKMQKKKNWKQLF